MERLEVVLQQLKVDNCDEELQKISECEDRALNLCKVLEGVRQEIKQHNEEIEKLKTKENEMHTIITSNADKISHLKKKIENLQIKYQALVEAQKEYLSRLCASFKQDADVTTVVGNNMMELFDLKVKVEHFFADTWEIKNKVITLHFNVMDRIFDLQSMEPSHPRFTDIKVFLRDSSDISGFLYYARKYYQQDT